MSKQTATGEGLEGLGGGSSSQASEGTSDIRIQMSTDVVMNSSTEDTVTGEFISLSALYRTEDPAKELSGSAIGFYSAIQHVEKSLSEIAQSFNAENEADKVTAVSTFIKRVRDLIGHIDANAYGAEIVSMLQLTASSVRANGISLLQANSLRKALNPIANHVRLSREVVANLQRILESVGLESGIDFDL
jgi:hypothetical protein